MEWISVKDQLPEKKGMYLCCVKGFEDSECCDGWYYYMDFVEFGKQTEGIDFYEDRIVHRLSKKRSFKCNTGGYASKKVTHWMPLPERPKD